MSPAQLLLFALVSVVSIWLSVIDARTMLIPNRIVLPAIAASGILILFCGWPIAVTGYLAAAISFALFVALNLLARGQVGMGDAKLAVLLAFALGSSGWAAYLLGVSLGFAFGGVAALVKLIIGRGKNLSQSFAYGPYLTAGALLVLGLRLVAN